jgi:hypothetical protein
MTLPVRTKVTNGLSGEVGPHASSSMACPTAHQGASGQYRLFSRRDLSEARARSVAL